MAHTGLIPFPVNLDPRAQEFRPTFSYFQPQIYYPYPVPDFISMDNQFTVPDFISMDNQYTVPDFISMDNQYNFLPPVEQQPLPPLHLPPPSSMPTRSLLLSLVSSDVSESLIRRELEVFGDVRAVDMDRIGSGIVTVHFYDIRHAQCAVAEIQEQHMQHQSRLRNHYQSFFSNNVSFVVYEYGNQFLPPLPPPARGLVAGRVVWAQFIVPHSSQGPNQGTIVIFNLDHHQVTATKLYQMFQAFGEIKELRETPLKKHQKFVEYYDIRDAAKALSVMNGKEINGKQMVIEFSRPGGYHRRISSNKPTGKYIYPDAGPRTSPPLRAIKKLGSGNENPRNIISKNSVVEDKSKASCSKKNSSISTSSSSSKGGSRAWKGSRAARDYDPCYLINEEAIINDSNTRDARTTVMIKNIPNKYSQKLLLGMLDNHCAICNDTITASNEDQPLSSYDFVYLPMDFINKCNVGYGFVNMTSPEATLRLYKAFHNQTWLIYNSKKICHVTYARLQGIEALKEHFKNSKFPCETGDYLPVLFSPPRDGRLLTDPTPVVALPPPPAAAAGDNISDGSQHHHDDHYNVLLEEIGDLSINNEGKSCKNGGVSGSDQK